MTKAKALDAFLYLIRDRLSICNRNKENDALFEEAYNYLSTCGFNEFSISDSLERDIENGTLVEFNKSYEKNGYIISLDIKKSNKLNRD